jgi:hypothetical protein
MLEGTGDFTFCFHVSCWSWIAARMIEPHRRMVSSGLLRRVARVRTDVSEERTTSIIRVEGVTALETLASFRFLNIYERTTWLLSLHWRTGRNWGSDAERSAGDGLPISRPLRAEKVTVEDADKSDIHGHQVLCWALCWFSISIFGRL